MALLLRSPLRLGNFLILKIINLPESLLPSEKLKDAPSYLSGSRFKDFELFYRSPTSLGNLLTLKIINLPVSLLPSEKLKDTPSFPSKRGLKDFELRFRSPLHPDNPLDPKNKLTGIPPIQREAQRHSLLPQLGQAQRPGVVVQVATALRLADLPVPLAVLTDASRRRHAKQFCAHQPVGRKQGLFCGCP